MNRFILISLLSLGISACGQFKSRSESSQAGAAGGAGLMADPNVPPTGGKNAPIADGPIPAVAAAAPVVSPAPVASPAPVESPAPVASPAPVVAPAPAVAAAPVVVAPPVVVAAPTPPSLIHTAASIFNVRAYGAAGDGATDDTAAIQATINAAQANGGGIVFIPAGRFKLSSNLSITSGLTIRGVGYQGAFTNLALSVGSVPGINLSDLNNCSCLVQTNPAASVIYAVTSDAIQIQSLVIYYASSTPFSGATGVAIFGGFDTGNSQSLIRDTLIYGADRGITLTNTASFVIDNDVVYNSQTYGLIHDAAYSATTVGLTAAHSAGDWQISNSTFAALNSRDTYAHILMASGGGGRITSNRMIALNHGYGVQISPSHKVTPIGAGPDAYNVEPMVITNNVIQGAGFGIGFTGSPDNNGMSTLGVIANNQIWALTDIYSQAGQVIPSWIHGWTIYSNSLNCQGGGQSYCINMNGAVGVNITSNHFYLSNGTNQTRFGAQTSKMNLASNAIENGVSAVNLNGNGSHAPDRVVDSSGLMSYPLSITFNVMGYGAVGDGVHDDTQAIQLAINAAQMVAGTVFIPAGKFKISAPLTITSSITVQGIGYQSAGTQFITTNGGAFLVKPETLRSCSCIIQTNPAASIFYAVTVQPVQIMGLELFYLNGATPFSGATAVAISGNNHGSVIRDLFIQGADRGLSFVDSSAWTVDNVFFYNCATYGLLEDGTAANSGGWQIMNSTFATGTPSNYSHIALLGGGSGRIFANKLNVAGNGTQQVMNGIAIAPAHSVAGGFQVDPVYIMGNSIEGEFVGIAFRGSADHNGISSSGVIIGNQIWADIPIHAVSSPATGVWINNWTIAGNVMNSQGNYNWDATHSCSTANTQKYNINLDGASAMTVAGNLFSSVCPVTAVTYFGASMPGLNYVNNLVY